MSGTATEVRRLLSQLRLIFDQASRGGIQKPSLVLLGDIFDFLKSEEWLIRAVRPWENSTSEHVATVGTIMESIVASNAMFFDGLAQLATDYELKMHYVPGNHDRAINTEMGGSARELLLDLLPLITVEDRFPDCVRDPEHQLFAQHGHEWDPHNRYVGNYASYGDALVIEFVVAMPRLVATKLGVDSSSLPGFFYDIDNLRPSGLRTIIEWIVHNVAKIQNFNPQLTQCTEDSLKECIEKLTMLRRTVRFETIERSEGSVDLLESVFRNLGKRYGYLKTGRFLPIGETASDTYGEFARSEFETPLELNYRYLVCGHTHAPTHLPLVTNAGSDKQLVRLYLNTGSWRRVQRLVPCVGPSGESIPSFSCHNEECIVTIFNAHDQKVGFPKYEQHRLTHAND